MSTGCDSRGMWSIRSPEPLGCQFRYRGSHHESAVAWLVSLVTMNVFQSALHAVASHVRVCGHRLIIAQGDPFSQVEIDLRQVSAHKLPGMATLHLRLFRGRWQQYSLEGFRPSEISRLRALLTRWEKQNHQKHEAVD